MCMRITSIFSTIASSSMFCLASTRGSNHCFGCLVQNWDFGRCIPQKHLLWRSCSSKMLRGSLSHTKKETSCFKMQVVSESDLSGPASPASLTVHHLLLLLLWCLQSTLGEDALDAPGAGPSAVPLQVEDQEASFSSSLLWLLQVLHFEWAVGKSEREEASLTAKNCIHMTGCDCLKWVHLIVSCLECPRDQQWFLHWASKTSENWATCWIFLQWATRGWQSLIFLSGRHGYYCCWRQPPWF